MDLSRPDPEIRRQIAQLLAESEARLQTLETERGAIARDDEAALDRNGLAIKEAQEHVNLLKNRRTISSNRRGGECSTICWWRRGS